MKNSSENKLTFKKKSLTELQKKESINIDGGILPNLGNNIREIMRKLEKLGRPTE